MSENGPTQPLDGVRVVELTDGVAGAYAGRAPFQLGKPVGAIVGPYTIESVEYQAVSVTTNKAAQEAVRGFGQAPTNYAIETAIDRVAAAVGVDRVEVRRRNYIRADQFPYRIPSGMVVDTHVTRLSRKLDLAIEEDPVKIEAELTRLFHKRSWIDLSHRLILHGRYVCKAKSPRCGRCPLNEICARAETKREVRSWKTRAAWEKALVESKGQVDELPSGR